MAENNDALKEAIEKERQEAQNDNPVPQGPNFKALGIAMLPTSPVSFKGGDSLVALARLALYGSLAYATRKNKTLMYAFMGATGLSLLTSLSNDALNKANGNG